MSETGLKFPFTEKNISSPWTCRLLFWRSLLKIFDGRPIFFSSLSENEEKILNFSSNLFSPNCSYGQVECILDNRYKNILREGREMFTHCPKMMRNSNFFKKTFYSPTCSSVHVECNFGNSWKSFGNRLKKFVQLPKKIEEVQIFGEVFSQNCCYGQLEWKNFGKPDENS